MGGERSPPPDNLREMVAALTATVHEMKNQQQVRLAADIQAARAPAPRSEAEGGWAKNAAPIIGSIVGALTILGVVGGLILAPTVTRISALETKTGEQGASLAAVAQRMQAAETRIATAATVRDQQYEGLRDRVQSLDRADQEQTKQAVAITNTLAGLLPRVEEMLRRQERLENRLSAPSTPYPRPNSDDEPARFVPSEARSI